MHKLIMTVNLNKLHYKTDDVKFSTYKWRLNIAAFQNLGQRFGTGKIHLKTQFLSICFAHPLII